MAKNLLLWVVIAAVLLTVFNNYNAQPAQGQVTNSEFTEQIQQERVRKVVTDGRPINGQRIDGSTFQTVRPMVEDPKLIDDLLSHNVQITGVKPESQSLWTQLLVASFPILIILAIFILFTPQLQDGADGRRGPMALGQ